MGKLGKMIMDHEDTLSKTRVQDEWQGYLNRKENSLSNFIFSEVSLFYQVILNSTLQPDSYPPSSLPLILIKTSSANHDRSGDALPGSARSFLLQFCSGGFNQILKNEFGRVSNQEGLVVYRERESIGKKITVVFRGLLRILKKCVGLSGVLPFPFVSCTSSLHCRNGNPKDFRSRSDPPPSLPPRLLQRKNKKKVCQLPKHLFPPPPILPPQHPTTQNTTLDSRETSSPEAGSKEMPKLSFLGVRGEVCGCVEYKHFKT